MSTICTSVSEAAVEHAHPQPMRLVWQACLGMLHDCGLELVGGRLSGEGGRFAARTVRGGMVVIELRAAPEATRVHIETPPRETRLADRLRRCMDARLR